MYLHFPSQAVRIILRLYFIAILFFTCVFGEKCLRSRTRLRLLRGENVSVTSKTFPFSFAEFLTISVIRSNDC